jgi:hypothetical protein
VYLEGATTRQSLLSRDHHGPRAILNGLERLAGAYGSESERVQRDLAIAESQLRDYHARLGKPFSHDAVLSELTVLRDRLKACLSGAMAEQGTEPQPSASELSERIKALKSANAAEPSPHRTNKSAVAAEEPVTARIRRRMDAALSAGPHQDGAFEHEKDE